MPITPGSRLGPYEILAPIGAGGMGEVYRARDTRLDRTVAVKVLAAGLAARPEVRERFEREARVVSGLNHPHICTLYDIGRQDDTDFLVMEHLDGETLADRLSRGHLPLEQVLRHGIEIAGALDRAHRQGVVHRDLKPGNIMLTRAGAKLLDFGLARLLEAGSGGENQFRGLAPSALPTRSRPLTQEGALLGTLQYMAPEQLEGREADARTDIFALGAVLYEMATGRRAFEGKSQASLIAAILEHQPPSLATLQPMTPPALDRAIRTCLEKDPEERWQSAHDLMRELKWIGRAGQEAESAGPAPARGARRERLAWGLAAAAVLVASVAGFLAWRAGEGAAGAPRPIIRFAVPFPPAVGPPNFEDWPAVAISPDGTRLVYAAGRGNDSQLYLRSIDRMVATPIPGTESGGDPFFSPDGESIGFSNGRQLLKISLAGGRPLALCASEASRGADWGADGRILFVPGTYAGVVQVPDTGGTPQPITRIDTAAGERQHRWPQVLPGGKAILFTAGMGTGFDNARIVVQSLETGERRVVLEGGTFARYLPTGHLIYVRAGSLLAVPFDLEHLRIAGATVPVIDELATEDSGAAHFAVSKTGVLAYIPTARASKAALFWVDRTGAATPVGSPETGYYDLDLSPDGRRIAFMADNDSWVYDVARGALSRLTSGIRTIYPIWSPDGEWVAFGSERAGPWNVFRRRADGTGEEEHLLASPATQMPVSWSPDGTLMTLAVSDPETNLDIWVLDLKGDRASRPFLRTTFLEGSARFSPDGRLIAYDSDESGRPEVYVRPYPGADRKWQVSTNGGGDPVWARSGRELFYREGSRLMSAPVTLRPGFTAGAPRLLFEGPYTGRYAVTPDDRRFLMMRGTEGGTAEAQINVVLGWFDELRRRVPVPDRD